MRLCRIILLCSIFFVESVSAANHLLKMYLHQGRSSDKLILYFSHAPTIEHFQNSEIFISCCLATDEVDGMVKQLRHLVRPWYSLQTKKSPQGIHLRLKDVSGDLEYEQASFNAIGSQKGIIFRMRNRQDKKGKLGIKQPVVVVDFGHGGSDDGAVGYKGVKEKDITRAVGKRLIRLLQQRGINVRVTRKGDETVLLDERTKKANRFENAVLFISLHANSSQNRKVLGIETFCIDPLLFSYPHQQSKDRFSQLPVCLNSCHCADMVHSHLMRTINSFDKNSIDRKVKRAVSQVLLGAQIPAILVELGFVTHAHESQLLQDSSYQQLLAQGIAQGVQAYLSFYTKIN